MVNSLPLIPLQSFYYLGPSESEFRGVPFFGGWETVAVHGLPLARVDRTSVAMAYVRGLFGAMTVVGFIAIVPLVMYFQGQPLDEFALVATKILIGSFIVGISGGLLTYAIPLTPRRERQIRSCCGELLGVCADPARLSAAMSAAVEEHVEQLPSQKIDDHPRLKLIKQLILIRTKIAQGIDTDAMERKTDELLNWLE